MKTFPFLFLHIDIDECSTKKPCQQKCHNFFGTYSCSCYFGYKKIDRSSPQSSQCTSMSLQYSSTFFMWDQFSCALISLTGWNSFERKIGFNDLIMCNIIFYLKIDVNECLTLPCKCAQSQNCIAQCYDTTGSFKCLCNKGFELNNDQRTCQGKDKLER